MNGRGLLSKINHIGLRSNTIQKYGNSIFKIIITDFLFQLDTFSIQELSVLFYLIDTDAKKNGKRG